MVYISFFSPWIIYTMYIPAMDTIRSYNDHETNALYWLRLLEEGNSSLVTKASLYMNSLLPYKQLMYSRMLSLFLSAAAVISNEHLLMSFRKIDSDKKERRESLFDRDQNGRKKKKAVFENIYFLCYCTVNHFIHTTRSWIP